MPRDLEPVANPRGLSTAEINAKCQQYEFIAKTAARRFSKIYRLVTDPNEVLSITLRACWKAVCRYDATCPTKDDGPPMPEDAFVTHRIYQTTVAYCTHQARKKRSGAREVSLHNVKGRERGCDTYLPAPEEDPEVLERRSLGRRLIELARERLVDDDRLIFRLYWCRGLSAKRIAKIYGCTTQNLHARLNTIHNRVYRIALADSELARYARRLVDEEQQTAEKIELARIPHVRARYFARQERVKVENIVRNPHLRPMLNIDEIKARAAQPWHAVQWEDARARRERLKAERRKIYLRGYNERRRRRHATNVGD
jgi:RNA polymerase sigma factor (sigma-70 family)